MPNAILVINAGSSSIKFSAFTPVQRNPVLIFKGQIEGIGTRPRIAARDAANHVLAERAFDPVEVHDHGTALHVVSELLSAIGAETRLVAVGHRVAHGGAELTAPTVVDDGVIGKLNALVSLAPLHQPANLAGILAVRHRHPKLLQVACFDTAFHRGHPEVANRFALPEALFREGVRRYGFHGLSCEYITRQLQIIAPEIAARRVIIAHLGSGASMCAVNGGQSLDSTMGFTALDGLPMGTRCGGLDPGVVLHLIRKNRWTADEVEHLLYHDCGLRGLSGLSSDVRDLMDSQNPAAKLALDYFVYQCSRHLGALAAVLEGIDAVVFTAGIGERSAELRARICRRSAWLGLRLDEGANRVGGPRISPPESAVQTWVIPTDEERMIAQHTLELLHAVEPAMAS